MHIHKHMHTHTVAQWHSHRVNTICGCSVVENLCSFLFIAFIHSLSFVLFIFVSRSLLLLLPAASHFLVICCLLEFHCVTVILTYLTFNCRVHNHTHTHIRHSDTHKPKYLWIVERFLCFLFSFSWPLLRQYISIRHPSQSLSRLLLRPPSHRCSFFWFLAFQCCCFSLWQTLNGQTTRTKTWIAWGILFWEFDCNFDD